MTNNDINKIIEDIKDKIEECIKYLKQEKHRQVVQKFKEIKDIYGKNLNIMNGRDITNKLQEKYPKEMEEFDEQLKINMDKMDIQNLCEIGKNLYYIYKDFEAIQYLKKIIDIGIEGFEMICTVGEYLYKLGEKPKGIQCFRKLLNLASSNIEVLYRVAMKLKCLGENHLLREYFQQILKINIDYNNVKQLYYKGMSHLYLSWEITKGIRCFKRILEIGTDNVEILFNVGENLCKLGQLEKAVDCFEKVLNNTNDIRKLYDLAKKIRYLKENNVIISNTRDEYLYKILDIHEKNNEEILYKGMSAYLLFIDDKAKDYFEKVAEFEKNNTNNIYISAEHLYLLKQYTSAKKCYEKIFLMDIADINILSNVGEKLYKLGEKENVLRRY